MKDDVAGRKEDTKILLSIAAEIGVTAKLGLLGIDPNQQVDEGQGSSSSRKTCLEQEHQQPEAETKDKKSPGSPSALPYRGRDLSTVEVKHMAVGIPSTAVKRMAGKWNLDDANAEEIESIALFVNNMAKRLADMGESLKKAFLQIASPTSAGIFII